MLLTLSISFGGVLGTLIGTVITDYSKHKKEGSQDFYLSTLLTRSKNWVLDNKFHFFLVSLPFILLIAFGIPSLLVTPVSGILGMIFFCFFVSVLMDGVLRFEYYANKLRNKDREKIFANFLPKVYISNGSDVISDSKNSTTITSYMNNQSMQSLLSERQPPFKELIDELDFNESTLELNGSKHDGTFRMTCYTNKFSFEIEQKSNSIFFRYFDDSISSPILIIKRDYDGDNYHDKITFIQKTNRHLLPEKIKDYALKLQQPKPLAITGDYTGGPFTSVPSTVTVEELDYDLNTSTIPTDTMNKK